MTDPGGKQIPCTIENGEIRFTVTMSGVYIIRNTGSSPVIPAEPAAPAQKPGEQEPETEKLPFTDIAKGQYYYDAVRWAVEHGVTSGLTADRFGPDAACTRAQFVTMLHRAASSPAPKAGAMPFTDVPAGSYYEAAVRWAVENGITTGVSETSFAPNAPCTRGQIVTFLYRYLGK